MTEHDGSNATEYLMILDESGSMGACREEVVASFNEQVRAIRRAAQSQAVRVSLVAFSNPDRIRTLLWREDAGGVPELGPADYAPHGLTAMLDAVWSAVAALHKEVDDATACFLTVLSDGCENASVRRSRHDVAELLRDVESTGRWTITYLGANHDLARVSDDLGIPRGNLLRFHSHGPGTLGAMGTSRDAFSAFLRQRRRGVTSSANVFSDGTTVREAVGVPGSRDTAGSMAGRDVRRATRRRAAREPSRRES